MQLIREHVLEPQKVLDAALATHDTLQKIQQFEVDIFQILGMRNLSAFVGETFCANMIKICDGMFQKNPHQDGYPDLLLMDNLGKSLYEKYAHQLREKTPFSPFATGGIEVKATCGLMPSGVKFTKRGVMKPDMYDQRIAHLTHYEYKAHHRKTNYLLGLFWDFIDGAPFIVAAFYSNALTETDWSAVVLPSAERESRTTSVSNLTRPGIKKLYDNWIFILSDTRYIDFFNTYNGDTKMPSTTKKKMSFDDL